MVSKFKYSQYHKFIPERFELLDNLRLILNKNYKIHFSINYANRKLPFISYVINPKVKETIMITAGCHGNEPAPVYALYNFLKNKPKIKNKRIVVIPCIVPFGFCLHIDRNCNGIDINRDFFSKQPQRETKFLKQLVKKYNPTFVLNMHEDPDENMFFLYLEGEKYAQKAEKLISLISKDMKVYKRKKVHNELIINGIVKSINSSKSFEDYLKKQNIPNFCVETPGTYPLQDRIKVYEKVLKFIIK